MKQENVTDQIKNYLEYYPEEVERISSLEEQMKISPDLFDRKIVPGHITGSGIVIENGKILMIFHPFLKKWLQPGGHVELGETPLDAATRELLEETGLSATMHSWHQQHKMPFDIDVHCIPANEKKGEEAHLHYDFRYLLCIDKSAHAQHSQEHESAWISLEEVEEKSLADLVHKLSGNTILGATG